MGGGCICKNYINKYLLNLNDNNLIIYENGQKQIPKNFCNKKSIRTSNTLYNIIENQPETKKYNKRFSEFHKFDKRHFEKSSNLKNLGNKISNNDGRNTSFNDNSFINQKNGANEEENKKILSNNNSINLNGSNIFQINTIKIENGIKEEEEENKNSYSNGKNNINIQSNRKNKSFINKVKDNELSERKSGTNFNCNLGENNFIFINIRGSSFLNRNDLEKIESTTPKMSIEKGNLEEITKGHKRIFSHFCNKIMRQKRNQSICNNHLVTSDFYHGIDINNYCEEMLKTINSIRINPESFILNIDFLINNNIIQTEEGIFLQSYDIDEKIKLMENYKELFENAKKVIKELINPSKNLKRFQYKNDLEIVLDESEIISYDYDYKEDKIIEDEENNIKNIPMKLNLIYDDVDIIDEGIEEKSINENKTKENNNIIDFDEEENKKGENNIDKKSEKKIKMPIIKINNSEYKNSQFNKNLKPKIKKKKHNIDLNLDLSDDKIANLILQKRKEIKSKYPLNIFKLSVIKDIKISILTQIAMEEFHKESIGKTLKDIIFDPNYKYFAVSWTNEINRNFISISCFA